MVTFKNNTLNKEYSDILNNIEAIEKGNVGNASIWVEAKSPKSFSSYIYNNVADRDADLKQLQSLIK